MSWCPILTSLRWVNPKAGYVFQIRMIKVENTTQPPPTQFAAIERNFHETQAGQGLRKSHTPKKVGVRFGVRAISLNCVDLRGPNTQKHMYCVEFLRVASRFDSFPKSLPLRVTQLCYICIQSKFIMYSYGITHKIVGIEKVSCLHNPV